MAEAASTKSMKETSASGLERRPRDLALQPAISSAQDQVLNLQRMIGNRSVSKLLQSDVGSPPHHSNQGRVRETSASLSETRSPEADSHGALLLRANAESGRPLDESVRMPMEKSLGVILSGVRVHSGPASEAAAESLGARAYTIGSKIHLGPDARRGSSHERDRLLAHEAVHTVQQGGRSFASAEKISLSQPGDRAEVEADRIAESVTSVPANRNPQPGFALRNQQVVTPIAQRCDSGVMIQRQKEKGREKDKKKAEEDWNFTPADYAALIKKKGKLKIAEDSSWFPKELQVNLLNTLNALLDPSRKPSATEGVNVKDFFHGHVGVTIAGVTSASNITKSLTPLDLMRLGIEKGETGLPEGIRKKRKAFRDKAAEVSAKVSVETKDKVTEKNLIDRNKDQDKVLTLAKELLSETLKSKGVVAIYHTFETNDPSDLAGKPKVKTAAGRYRSLWMGDPRRNYITPLDTNKPGQYFPPEEDNASSWREGGGRHTHGDFYSVMQFNFLVDNKGEVHVRAGNADQLSTLTGAPPK